MALVPLKSHINTKQTAYVPYFSTGQLNASTISTGNITANEATISSIVAEYVSSISLDSEYINTSTINTLHVDLDGQILTASATELLLNGVPIATQSSLSSIGDWALEPAISSVQMAGNDLNAAGTISSLNVRSGNGFFQNLIAFNSLFVSTATSTISTSIEFADEGNFSSINAGAISSGLGTISSLLGDSAQFSTISSLVGSISSLKTDELFTSSFTTDTISSNSLSVSSINGSEFTSTGIVVQVAGVSSLVANSISSLGAEIRNALVSTIQFKPSFDFSLNIDTAPVAAAILGGLTRVGIGLGTGLGLIGTGLIAAVASRPTTTSVNSNVYYQYAQPTQFQFSTLGAPTSTFTRLVSSSGAGNAIPGQEIIISSIISSGTLCLRSLGDPINLTDPSTFTSTIQSFGEWVEVPPETLQVISSFATASVSSLAVSSINGAVYPPVIPFNDDWALYPAVSTIAFSTGVTAVVSASAGSDIALTGTAVKLIAGYTDAQNLLLVSSISTGKILGANDNLFGLGIQGLEIQTAPTGQVWISSPQTNIAGLTNTSTIASFLFRGRDVAVSSVQVSSLAFAQTAAYGLSSLMYVSTQLTASGTSTATILNTDFSVGTNDLFCGQLRLNAGANQNAAEIAMTGPDGRFEVIDIQIGDPIFRNRYGTNSAVSTGYFLDSYGNKPFFSTINQSTAMMCYFPSTTHSTIGFSTLSFMPPKVVAGAFTSLSTQVVPAANSSFAIAYTNTDVAVGGISYSTTAIVIPSPGIYETGFSIQLDKSGGGVSPCDFWLRKNGTDVPNTASRIVVNGTAGEVLATVTIILDLTTNDKIEVVMASSDATMAATFFQSTITTPYTRPAIPSLITNIKCLNY